MKLEKFNADKVISNKSFPGLFSVDYEHKIASTEALFHWTGPRIDFQVWHEVMSFFRWTNDTTHSESQVRLFVNSKLGVWKAWAFPQEARTGMSARELQTDDTKKQREGFKDDEGWIYFGTIHHHCNMSAFQSGVDQNNEEIQDGLHITMGNMNSTRHDFHGRFYLKGSKFTPDMSLFWNIGDEVRGLIPPKLWHDAAIWQMTNKVEVPFPDQWKANLIEVRSAFPSGNGHLAHGGDGSFFDYRGSSGKGYAEKKSGVESWSPGKAWSPGSTTINSGYVYGFGLERRKSLALEELAKIAASENLDSNFMYTFLGDAGTPEAEAVLGLCREYNIEPEDLLDEWNTLEAQKELKEENSPQSLVESSPAKQEVKKDIQPDGSLTPGVLRPWE